MTQIWQTEVIIEWSQIILSSYRDLLKHDLIDRDTDKLNQSQNLYYADFVVFSHNTDTDPLYNYGNKMGLQLWEMDWQQLMTTPSRTTTQPLLREEREKLMNQTTAQGYVTNVQGIRISAKGTKYQINDLTVWNLKDDKGNYCGQAATFSKWKIIS